MLSSVAAHQLFNCARERERFAKRRSFAHFHDHARDASRGRFFAQLTKETGQLVFGVIVYDCRGGEARSRVHPHVERTVSNETEPALRVFELPGRNTQIKKRASNGGNPELVENTICVSEICLPHDDAPANMRQTLGHVTECVRILIQSENIGATFQKRFSVPAATTRSVEDQRTCFRLEQFKDFLLQDRAMVNKIL